MHTDCGSGNSYECSSFNWSWVFWILFCLIGTIITGIGIKSCCNDEAFINTLTASQHERRETYQLKALGDRFDNKTHGQFSMFIGIGGGSTDSSVDPKYWAFVGTDIGGYRLLSYDLNKTLIKISNNVHMEKLFIVTRECTKSKPLQDRYVGRDRQINDVFIKEGNVWCIYNEQFKQYEFFVPDGSIVQNYTLDLK